MVFSTVYAAVARRRRRSSAAHPERQRRLRAPVISIGNLAVGGRGKTPLVASIASMLIARGERPSILSRGYGRRRQEEGVVVVRDPGGIRADLDRSGDEPLMLARRLEGAAVLVSPDRYLAGRLAEQQFGCTVHLLDDGFQHLALHRDLDVVIVNADDLRDGRTLPGGRLREPLDSLAAADAVVVAGEADVSALAPGRPVWRASRRLERARLVEPFGERIEAAGPQAFAVAGIAHPQQFLDDLRQQGWCVRGSATYRDHHRYSAADTARIMREARDAGADLVLTTEKDLVRLLPFRPFPLPVAWVPLTMTAEPADAFDTWIVRGLDAARRERCG
ncbi:MAG TPA: tetraacyldisaccharide 4'-kinase [Vicinamibacterales bacterium]|nr:tetraacyldisaccharide 4'-kinase [Vicinamibacterales bacterium]